MILKCKFCGDINGDYYLKGELRCIKPDCRNDKFWEVDKKE